MIKSIKVGYLPMYIKLYDDNNPHYRDPMVNYMHTLVSMLESQGVQVVCADVCRLKEEFDAAAQLFQASDVDAVVTQHLAYSPSLESIETLLSLNVPLIVLDTTPDYALLEAAGYEKRISNNHGIHGVQDMCSLLRRNGREYYLCAGHAMHSDVIARVAGLCRAAAVKKSFQNARIGSVGGTFTGMGDFQVTSERLRQDIGAEVRIMEPEIVRESIGKVTNAEIDAEIASDRERYTIEAKNLEAYRAATKSGLAVRKWVEDAGLTAVSINFKTLDRCGLPKMPFPECCKFLGRRVGYAGEGDVLTAGLVGALASVYPNTTFTEMFCPDWKENVLLLSHMGESNPNLAKWKPVISDLKFNYNTCGDTVGMYSCMRPGSVVLVNLAPMKDRFRLILTQGEILDAGLEFGAYRYSTQAWYKPCKPLPAFLEAFSNLGGTHHSAMVYDADIGALAAFGRMMGFEVHILAGEGGTVVQ
ncbi:MAG: hypothetical protein VB034_08555 [Eubacteriales bacterium]|nr:hypothetical protein [Eubacteriales bacterium]